MLGSYLQIVKFAKQDNIWAEVHRNTDQAKKENEEKNKRNKMNK